MRACIHKGECMYVYVSICDCTMFEKKIQMEFFVYNDQIVSRLVYFFSLTWLSALMTYTYAHVAYYTE